MTCIEWTGAKTPRGYGNQWFQGKQHGAHRVAYYEATGIWPEVVRHTCDNPPCINPEHLVPGTQADNMHDRMDRGRWDGGHPKLNHDMPDQHQDNIAYKLEMRRRQRAGTWVYRKSMVN